jgi:hypothetical protein
MIKGTLRIIRFSYWMLHNSLPHRCKICTVEVWGHPQHHAQFQQKNLWGEMVREKGNWQMFGFLFPPKNRLYGRSIQIGWMEKGKSGPRTRSNQTWLRGACLPVHLFRCSPPLRQWKICQVWTGWLGEQAVSNCADPGVAFGSRTEVVSCCNAEQIFYILWRVNSFLVLSMTLSCVSLT